MNTDSVLLLSLSWNPPRHVLLSGKFWFGMKIPLFHMLQQSTLNQIGSSAPRANLRNSTKLASGNCILERLTQPADETTPPMHLFWGKQCLPFSHLADAPHLEKNGLECSWSMSTGGLLVVSFHLNPLQTCSPSWKSLIWHENALFSHASGIDP